MLFFYTSTKLGEQISRVILYIRLEFIIGSMIVRLNSEHTLLNGTKVAIIGQMIGTCFSINQFSSDVSVHTKDPLTDVNIPPSAHL